MRSFRFKLSLRLKHPSMTVADITEGVGITPKGGGNAGERLSTPTGSPLEGFNKFTYWYAEISNPEDFTLVEALDLNLRHLEERKPFMTEFASSGGTAEYFVGWFTTQTSGGETIPSSLMGRMAILGIELGLDVYAPDPPSPMAS